MSRRAWKTVRLEAQEFSTGGKGLSRSKKRMHLETKDCLRKGVWILGSCRDNREVGLTHCKENIYYLAVTIGNAALWRRGLVIPESGIKHSGSQICVCVSSYPGSWRKFGCFGPGHLQGSCSVGVEWSPRSLSLTTAQEVSLMMPARVHSLRATTPMEAGRTHQQRYNGDS